MSGWLLNYRRALESMSEETLKKELDSVKKSRASLSEINVRVNMILMIQGMQGNNG